MDRLHDQVCRFCVFLICLVVLVCPLPHAGQCWSHWSCWCVPMSHAGKWKTMCPLLYNGQLSLPPGEAWVKHTSPSLLCSVSVAVGFFCSQSLEFERIITLSGLMLSFGISYLLSYGVFQNKLRTKLSQSLLLEVLIS